MGGDYRTGDAEARPLLDVRKVEGIPRVGRRMKLWMFVGVALVLAGCAQPTEMSNETDPTTGTPPPDMPRAHASTTTAAAPHPQPAPNPGKLGQWVNGTWADIRLDSYSKKGWTEEGPRNCSPDGSQCSQSSAYHKPAANFTVVLHNGTVDVDGAPAPRTHHSGETYVLQVVLRYDSQGQIENKTGLSLREATNCSVDRTGTATCTNVGQAHNYVWQLS